MPALIWYMIRNMLTGAAIGAACWLALLWHLYDIWHQPGLIPSLLGLWGFASLFALGYLATALALASDSKDFG